MIENNFYYRLAQKIKCKDSDGANEVVMTELGKAVADNKSDFIEVLRNAGIPVEDDSQTSELINKFVENAPYNDQLLVGASLLLGHKNKTANADGDGELSDTGIKATYKVMYEYFDGEEPTSNWVGAIAKAVGSGADLGGKIVEGRNQKKYGAQIQLGKQQEARAQLMQSVIAKKQQEAQAKEDEKKRTSKKMTIALVGGGILVAGLIGLGLYFKFRKK